MTVTIKIDAKEQETQVAQALDWISSGFLIAAPLEYGYVYLADAFTHDAVRSMHVLRRDELGVAAQVLIPNMEVLAGIARDVSAQGRVLMNNFWPGSLSFILRPHRGLGWDLGDGKELDQICVRVPDAEFVLALLRKSGPLAAVSAADAGNAPILEPGLISRSNPILAGIFEAGELRSSLGTTIVSDTETVPTVVRNGAITLEELREHVSDIDFESSGN